MTTIGRLGKNDVVLNDSQVSREHARIERRNGILYITDLNSTNGTILNGRRLQPYVPYQINEGDTICMGDFTILLHVGTDDRVRTQAAEGGAISQRMTRKLSSSWFAAIIAVVAVLGTAALLWYFMPSLLPNPITRVKPAVVLIRNSDSFGSGVIISKQGYVLTSNHILKTDSPIRVTVLDSAEFEGGVVFRDEKRDIAVIKINAGGFSIPAASLGDSSNLAVGDKLLAIGYPLGLKGGATVSEGIVSALRESDGVYYIQTDAPFNPGNAGSPLINRRGQVVGIMTARVAGESIEGMSFAITINDVKPLIAIYK
jgi:S1-C subfamily serine protease